MIPFTTSQENHGRLDTVVIYSMKAPQEVYV